MPASSLSHTALGLVALQWLVQGVQGNAGVFTYYETPMFYRIGNDGYIMAHEPEVGFGPSQWRNIIFPPVLAPAGNQCGGRGQENGYGQSPIVIPQGARDTCDTDFTGYEFEGGTCTWDELQFSILLNGVIVQPALGEDCSLGRMKIPGNDNYFNALQFHIHTGSEHSVDGEYYQAELHVVHQEKTAESFAVFGMFIDSNPEEPDADHPFFEYYLQGWEAVARQTDELCAAFPKGTGEWGPFSVFESRQMRITCSAPGQGINTTQTQWDTDTGMPILKNPDFPVEVPNVYEDLPTPGYGIYAYRGGLTTPPCTELVNWNLLDTPLYASRAQVRRLYDIILCFTEPTTCNHATIANEQGTTSRPVQPLLDRTVLHRCFDGPESEERMGVPVPLAPVQDYVHSQTRRCVFNSENGGPLQVCWQDTVLGHFMLLFPMFVLAMGAISFYILTRYFPWFPYTALMFIWGLIFGICSVTVPATDQLSLSIRMWEEIDAEVVLLGFLPGLIFRDAYTSNVFLFQKAFWQCVIMAFPMVLAGTCLTALVGYFILPYGWSWSFCMMFGSILSATDPVAVSALLNEVGAPPRLKIHISGESLLNDGSAIVFFMIFSQIFESEFNIPGFGNDIDLGTGVGLFFRMCFGAVVCGLVFSFIFLFTVYLLNRRFNYEENIVQVMSSITFAYLCYYTADAVFGCSGVISVVVLGTVARWYSGSLINDTVMMEKFWVLAEHMLNSVIFVLGGMVWGRIISNADPEHEITMHFYASDFGYQVLVWALLIVIRYFLIMIFYPGIARIGLGSNFKEAIFMGWGGLRGAVGIALAIHIDKHISHNLFRTDPRRRFTTQLFGIVGACALLTLVINGTLCGPLLNKLGLAKTGEARREIVHQYKEETKKKMFEYLVKLLGDPRFSGIDFGAVKKHISFFDTLTDAEMLFIVKRHKENTSVLEYNQPNLSTLKPFVAPSVFGDLVNVSRVDTWQKLKAVITMAGAMGFNEQQIKELHKSMSGQETEDESTETNEHLIELRQVFIDLVEKAYDEQFDTGEVDVRNVNMVVAYKTSIEVSRDEVASGEPLNDWKLVAEAMTGEHSVIRKLGILKKQQQLEHAVGLQSEQEHAVGMSTKLTLGDLPETNARDLIHYSTGFIEAHRRAQKAFKHVSDGQLLSADQIQVLDESRAQIEAVEDALELIDKSKVTTVLAHLVCQILLNKAGEWIGELNKQGLLRDQEAEHFFEEIQHDIDRVNTCSGEWILLPCKGEEGNVITESIQKMDDLQQRKIELEALLKSTNEDIENAANETFAYSKETTSSDDSTPRAEEGESDIPESEAILVAEPEEWQESDEP